MNIRLAIFRLWKSENSLENGAPGRARTCDPRLRRPVLYPAELRARMAVNYYTTTP